MTTDKSSRHSKIIGDLGELIVANWLSLSKWEVVLVDHTGIDIIAAKKRQKRIGITVKSRSRGESRKETESVNLFNNRKRINDRKKVLEACNNFGCKPWIAVYVEKKKTGSADLYLTSLAHYEKKYCKNKKRAIDDWKMGAKYTEEGGIYANDTKVTHVEMKFTEENWGL